MGNAKPVFNANQAANAQYVFGTPDQRAKSMPQRQITQKDVGIGQGWIKPYQE